MTSWGYINERRYMGNEAWGKGYTVICNDWSNDQGWNGKSILKNLNYTALIHLNTFTYFSFWSTHGQLSRPKERELTPQINSFFLSFWEILHPREKENIPNQITAQWYLVQQTLHRLLIFLHFVVFFNFFFCFCSVSRWIVMT